MTAPGRYPRLTGQQIGVLRVLLQGPYFTLSLAGFNLACAFVRRR